MRSPIVVSVLLSLAGCSQPAPNPELPAPPAQTRPLSPAPPQEVGALSVVAVRSCERNIDGGTDAIPEVARAVLESRYRSWEVAQHCPDDVTQYLTLHGRRTPSVTVGDFDGDGRSDHAVLLQSRADSTRTIIVALMQTDRGVEPLLAGGGLETISTAAKGSRDYSYEDNRMITLRNDTIVTSCCECCAHALIYRRGRFFRVSVAD
jgi:hypothetical protein